MSMRGVPLLQQNRSEKSTDFPTGHSKVLVQHFKKIRNIKYAFSLITCEFDECLLKIPNLINALEARLQFFIDQSSVNLKEQFGFSDHQLPPLLFPNNFDGNGTTGSVPMAYSFTWTRYEPCLEDFSTDGQLCVNDQCGIKLLPVKESEIVILLTVEKIKALLGKFPDQQICENLAFQSFGSSLSHLQRPVTCILFTNNKNTKISNKSLTELCVELQMNWNVHSTRISTNLDDVVTIICSYNRSIAERPFKEGRLQQDEGLAFLPSTIRKGLLAGRAAGPIPNTNTNSMMDHCAIEKSWASQVWLAQLGQWQGLTGEIANAIQLVYPTARCFYEACRQAALSTDSYKSKSNHPFEKQLANLEIRRGAGILTSSRRLGPEFARRLIALYASMDRNEVID